MQVNPSQDLPHAPNNTPTVNSAVPTNSQNTGASTNDQRPQSGRPKKKSKPVCRFYGTKKGCRAGDQCPYLHVQTDTSRSSHEEGPERDVDASSVNELDTVSKGLIPNPSTNRVIQGSRNRAPVSKPISSLQQTDPREFQISQVIRRFAPTRKDVSGTTTLSFKLQPSDPDFPFELTALECVVTIPVSYPDDGRPSLRVENKDIPRGLQINIEQGFVTLTAGSTKRTLLQLLNDLDRNLERFLASEKAQTIKIIANRRKDEPVKEVERRSEPTPVLPATVSAPKAPTVPAWSAQQKADAKQKRDTDIRQLEARMSRLPLFSASKDGVTFNVPLQIPKPTRLPLALQSLKELTLIVPALYHLEPCRIKLKGVSGVNSENVEDDFNKRAVDQKDASLMAQINHLTQNIHTMAISSEPATAPDPHPIPQAAQSATVEIRTSSSHSDNIDGIVDVDRPHLRFLSQPPPEWQSRAAGEEVSDSETTDEYDTEDGSSEESDSNRSETGGVNVPAPVQTTTVMEKGILLSFPQLELHGIELLELQDISLTVKCDRCKSEIDIKNIKPAGPITTAVRTESCNKCANPVSLSFRAEPMHINSIKGGYLDLEGCTVVDLLLSHFLPTCSECSTVQPAPGIISVRGDSPMAICRECHRRLNFKIPEVKFLRVSSNDARLSLPLRSKKKKENLGITAGTELPERGRCKHYSKSYRWFRFSCCNRVYPCDRCHDEKEEHPNEHANRMICGWCSREQNYRPEDCHACGRSVIRRTGGGFWEGGKGTRDKTKMSRKDPRKFKRIGGGAKGGEK